ncbi:MAG: undecaprenyl-diphosphate phosphatase, partial [Planctomycetes bacterium]|nr:undecaprenyl-diphosphate phosphatase [Planctomycetota bacterium]
MEATADAVSISYFWAALLGLVQGLAEFLPISSSGHLALVEHLGMGQPAPASFDILLHLATLLVVIAYFRRTIVWYYRNDIRVLLFVVAATVPTGLVGVFLKRYFEALRLSPSLICIGLLVTAALLATAESRRGAGYQLRDLGWTGAVAVGMFQAMALAPGVSRSGSTIAAGMLAGVDREEAFSFSFILSIPAVAGAVFLHVASAFRHGEGFSGLLAGVEAGPFFLGFIVAAASGYGAPIFWSAASCMPKPDGNGDGPVRKVPCPVGGGGQKSLMHRTN